MLLLPLVESHIFDRVCAHGILAIDTNKCLLVIVDCVTFGRSFRIIKWIGCHDSETIVVVSLSSAKFFFLWINQKS